MLHLRCLLVGVALLISSRPSPAVDFPNHPAVALDLQELAALRAQIAAGGWKAELYKSDPGTPMMHSARGTRSNADDWLTRKIEIPAHGGHYHHFFCDDGDRLEVPPGQKFVPGPYRCPKCGREYSGEKYEAALRRIVHSYFAQAAWDLAMVSAIEDRPEYAAKSAEILLAYAAAYPGPHTSTTQGGMLFQSLCESMWIIPLAQAYDLVYPRLNDDQRQRIETFLRITAKGIASCGVGGNWGSWHLSAVGVVGYAIHDAELVKWALEKFRKQIRDELGDDGLWPESVHTYHYFPLIAFIYLAEAARHAGTDLYTWEAKPGKSLLSMFTAPLDYAYPDFRLAAINDGWFEAFVPADMYELAYYRTKSPQFAWVLANAYGRGAPAGTVNGPKARQRGGLYAFLFGTDIPAQTQPPAIKSINFPVLGITMLRSPGGAMMSFDYGPFLGHGQPDKMGVTLFANDRLWMADYGTPGYGSSILHWYTSTFAHNTVVVDGQSQKRTNENAVKLWLDDPQIQAAGSTTTQAHAGVTHTRTVMRVGEYFVVIDDLKSSAPHKYDLYWHGEGKLQLKLETRGESSRVSRPVPGPVDTAHRVRQSPAPASMPAEVKELAMANDSANLSGRWQDGDTGVAFSIAADGPFVSMTAQCPAETASRRVPLLVCRREASSTSFTTVLLPFKGDQNVTVTRNDNEVTIRTSAFTDRIRLPQGDERPARVKD